MRLYPKERETSDRRGAGGPMATAGGLVFVAATADNRFRAFDSKSGNELWSTRLDCSITAIPMTYQG